MRCPVLFRYRNEIRQYTLGLEVIQQVTSFDEEMNTACRNDDRNEVLTLCVINMCCISVGGHIKG